MIDDGTIDVTITDAAEWTMSGTGGETDGTLGATIERSVASTRTNGRVGFGPWDESPRLGRTAVVLSPRAGLTP